MALTKVTYSMIEEAPKLVSEFGAIGNGTTDDKAALQAAFNWSKANKLPVYLSDDRYYTSGTLDAGGAIIRSLSGIPGRADPVFLQKPDGTYVFTTPDATWYFNTGHLTYTWAQMIADTATGCCIVSDFNGPILFAANTFTFDLDGFAIVGYQNRTVQDGIATAVPVAYSGTPQKINNIQVIGCGRHGINLERGYEVSTMAQVRCFANNGNGLRTGFAVGVDCATEYLLFRDCFFESNRLNGVFFSQVRKAVKFENCNFNNNGQYEPLGGIDPVLGYNRNVPATTAAMAAGVWVNDGALDVGPGFLFGFSMEDCFGEQMAVALHLRCVNGVGVCRDVRMQNNVWFVSANVAASAGEDGSMTYFDVDYASDWLFAGNHTNGLDYYRWSTFPALDPVNAMLFLDSPPITTDAEKAFYKLRYGAPLAPVSFVQAGGRVYGAQALGLSLGGLAAPGNVTTSIVSTDFTIGISNNTSNYSAVYSLTANFQTSASDQFGGYLLFVTKVPSAAYMMANIAMSSTSGFTGPPTINASTGEITIPAAAFFRFTIQRIDNILTNTTP
jgi:hypothetical protein